MPILTEDDQPIYFPRIKALGDELAGFLLRAQAIAEGPAGADRPLELTQIIDNINISKAYQTGQLKYWPIASSPDPVVEVRQGSHKNIFGRPSPVSNWVTLAPTDYQLEATGRLLLSISTAYGFSVGLSFATEARVIYTTGFDFTDDTVPVKTIKACVGAIATYLYFSEGGATAGVGPISKREAKDEYSIWYGESAYQGKIGADSNSAFESILRPLKQYAPRSF